MLPNPGAQPDIGLVELAIADQQDSQPLQTIRIRSRRKQLARQPQRSRTIALHPGEEQPGR